LRAWGEAKARKNRRRRKGFGMKVNRRIDGRKRKGKQKKKRITPNKKIFRQLGRKEMQLIKEMVDNNNRTGACEGVPSSRLRPTLFLGTFFLFTIIYLLGLAATCIALYM